MGYVILHMQKFTAGALRGIQSHIMREKDPQTNPDIDHNKTALNYNFVPGTHLNAKINQRIRALELKKSVRKDAIHCVGFIISGSHDELEQMPAAQQKEYFYQAKNWLENRYGSANLVYAVVHNDEKTPHIHVGIVPIKDGRLSAKALFTRTELQSLQSDFAREIGAKFGLRRGQEGSQIAYLTMSRYKAESALNATKRIETKAKQLNIEINKRAKDLLRAKIIDDEIASLELTTQVKKTIFSSNPHAKMPLESFNRLLELAKVGADAAAATDTINASLKRIMTENERLKQEITDTQRKLEKARQQYMDLSQTTELYTNMPTWMKTAYDKSLLKTKAEYTQIIDCINRACANGWHNSGKTMAGAKTIDALIGKLLYKYCGLTEQKHRLAHIKQCGNMMAKQQKSNQRPTPNMGDSEWSHRSPAQTDYRLSTPIPILVAHLGDTDEFDKLKDPLLSDIDRENLNTIVSLRDI